MQPLPSPFLERRNLRVSDFRPRSSHRLLSKVYLGRCRHQEAATSSVPQDFHESLLDSGRSVID